MIVRGNPLIMAGGGGSPAEKAIFGDGSDGVAVFSADTTWSADPEDTGMIVKNFESLTVEEGVTVAAGNRNCGMVIRVKGDCTIAGTLANRMSPKTILESDWVDFSAYPMSLKTTYAGNGGDGVHAWPPNTIGFSGVGGGGGTAMIGRFYGGGWGAGSGGGGGVPYGGGSGGSTIDITTAVTDELFVRGKNGGGGDGGYSSYVGTGGGGAGGIGPGAAGQPGTGGGGGGGAGNYGGGAIILFVGGELTISGKVDCSGGDGGIGGASSGYVPYTSGTHPTGAGGDGGGGGGGRIYIVHKGAIDNTGVLNVNGGVGGNAGGIGTTAVLTFDEYKEQEAA